jgi:hypothetical protein
MDGVNRAVFGHFDFGGIINMSDVSVTGNPGAQGTPGMPPGGSGTNGGPGGDAVATNTGSTDTNNSAEAYGGGGGGGGGADAAFVNGSYTGPGGNGGAGARGGSSVAIVSTTVGATATSATAIAGDRIHGAGSGGGAVLLALGIRTVPAGMLARAEQRVRPLAIRTRSGQRPPSPVPKAAMVAAVPAAVVWPPIRPRRLTG